MNPALVIAANSFLGRHLCNRLTAAAIPFRPAGRSRLPGFLPCDLTNVEQVESILANVRPQWIFSCAGATAQQSRAEMIALHVHGTQNLLRAVERHVPDCVVVLFGSAAEYGRQISLPINEDAEPNPTSAYGQTKLEQTMLAQLFAAERGLKVHNLRPFNMLGPGIGPNYFAGAFCDRLLDARRTHSRDPMSVTNPHATRDWIDVRDVADAAVRLAAEVPATGQIVNVATGIETPVLAVADALCRAAGEFRAITAEGSVSRSGIDRSCGDASRLRKLLKWSPAFNWRISATETWSHFRQVKRAA